MSVTNNHSNSNEWSKYLILAFICAMVSIEGISDVIADTDETLMTQSSKEKEIPFVVRSENVATRLGGFFGIHAFLKNRALPAILADNELAPFFGNLSETPDDIAQCFAMRLDHQLGGSSHKSQVNLESNHRCRSSMAVIHKGRNIPDSAITKFIKIVGEQAALAGVSADDIRVIAKVLEQNRSGIRNK
ncbi:MAG TPA: hypothetical protein PLV19_06450 [Nitrosomonas sp.]|nr:hypothetical protein [Nitrosomonas sp.]HQX13798.1 hypothetical protein [Nitrosomonas sp.]HRB33231.1 hypothetical protein [Nitrosomonas sp.]HRB45694.1 hypothetical protein [Nitrosomonas sp.]HRB77730.1 hypothetical protein [Nitrosomonas sp.]